MMSNNENDLKSKMVAFRCPIGLYNEKIAGKGNISQIMIGCLTSVKQCQTSSGAVKQGVKHHPGSIALLKLFDNLADTDGQLINRLLDRLSDEERGAILEFAKIAGEA